MNEEKTSDETVVFYTFHGFKSKLSSTLNYWIQVVFAVKVIVKNIIKYKLDWLNLKQWKMFEINISDVYRFGS